MDSTLLLIDLLGAGALLLWGLRTIKTGVLSAFGPSLRQAIARGTGNRVWAASSGLLVTLAVQSSTATAFITASFSGRGLISGKMAQAVLLGANLGTALTAFVLSFNLHWLGAAAIFVGYVIFSRSRLSRSLGIGSALIGLGLMLVALGLLRAATVPLETAPAMVTVLRALGNAPLFALIFGAALAFISSSSLAAVLFVAALSGTGIVAPELALILVAGANLGGAIGPFLAARPDGIEAVRLTATNLAIRSVGAVVLMLSASAIVSLAQTWLPAAQVFPVAAHVMFNTVLLVVFLPILGPVDRIALWLMPVPDRPEERRSHLDPANLEVPSLALAGAAREVLYMGDLAIQMLSRNLAAFLAADPELRRTVSALDDQVDKTLGQVKLYLAQLGALGLDEADRKRGEEITAYAINLEHVGDIVDRDLVSMTEKKTARGLRLSDQGMEEITDFFAATIRNLELAQSVFLSRELTLARRLAEAKLDVRRFEQESTRLHLARLQEGRPESLESSALHLDLLRDLKRVNAHIAAVANPILDEAGELGESRLRKAQTDMR